MSVWLGYAARKWRLRTTSREPGNLHFGELLPSTRPPRIWFAHVEIRGLLSAPDSTVDRGVERPRCLHRQRGRSLCEAVRVEPIEINAGAWYLRALRADDRVDDRPALADMGQHDAEHVARRTTQWETDTLYSWAVCEPTTGELLAEVTLDPASGNIGQQARRGHAQAAQTGADAVRRFADAILG